MKKSNGNQEGNREVCSKCKGTGVYRWGAHEYDLDGKLIRSAHSGTCFQCQGKGFVTVADKKRTNKYWEYRMREEISSMV